MATEDMTTTPATPAGTPPTQTPQPQSQTPPSQTPPKAASTSRVDRSFGSRPPADTSTAGTTTIADGVVAKVAGIAAREVSGVYALGGGGARMMGAIREAVSATDYAQGVNVEVGETQAAADITIVVEYPAPVQDVASNVRAAVSGAISKLVGLEVVEVNVEVNDVHLPSDDSEEESRVS
ncbi:Asp23/Gls24 family envelope stress response protein [Agromyces sp. NPDC058484]|uniref:Asp23/Gls24 family envelope stress response protein n=1 Tax=Agromyces sp. NPDC058484 TaxID=3346524 RepID=UPI00364B1BFE